MYSGEVIDSVNLMEVCGTHTFAIARSGIRSMLPSGIRLLSGPGCPVCVTPAEKTELILGLSETAGYEGRRIVTASYGDMLRVPGVKRGDTLLVRRASGADVRIVYSPLDALKIAEDNPDFEVIFLGVGFETTAPGTAVAIKEAAQKNLKNFTVFSMLKRLEPSIRTLASDPDFNVQGFLCPGHVAVILGEDGMRFFSDDLGFPAVISGFETEDILKSVAMLLRQIRKGEAKLENEYDRVVTKSGNTAARQAIDDVFYRREDVWRGLGTIPDSGLAIREKYRDFDAEYRFRGIIESIAPPEIRDNGCRCGDVIRGKISPEECPLFGVVCTPDSPEGPCMVSSEGACAASYKYGTLLI